MMMSNLLITIPLLPPSSSVMYGLQCFPATQSSQRTQIPCLFRLGKMEANQEGWLRMTRCNSRGDDTLSFALNERVVLEKGIGVHEYVRVGGGALEGALGV